jgi:nucleotide-binding universal stress UspA family protein
MFDNILLAVDGSEHALHTARVAGDLARATKAQTLRVIVVYDPVPSSLGEPNLSQAIATRQHEAQDILDHSIQAVGNIPGDIHNEIIEGHIADKIIDVASIRKSDVIVMGSRGRTGLASALLGSNSQKVVSHAPCPVLIVR